MYEILLAEYSLRDSTPRILLLCILLVLFLFRASLGVWSTKSGSAIVEESCANKFTVAMADFDWRPFAKSAQVHGCASSGDLSHSDKIEFRMEDGDLCFINRYSHKTYIKELSNVPVRTFHYRGHDAMYTLMNTEDELATKALTKSIQQGLIKISGTYSCVNSLCTITGTSSITIPTSLPVPVIFREMQELPGQVAPQTVKKGSAKWKIHRCHFGGDDLCRFAEGRLYMAGGNVGNFAVSSPLLERLAHRYSMKTVKCREANGKQLIAFQTRNLYVVSKNQLIAVAPNVLPDEEYILVRGASSSERNLMHRLDNAKYGREKGTLLACVEGIKIYARGNEFIEISGFVQLGFEADNVELLQFAKIVYRLKRVVEQRGRIMDIKEMARLTQSTPRQVLAYCGQNEFALKMISGEATYLGDTGSRNTVFRVSGKQVLRKLFGLTIAQHGDDMYRIGDGQALFVNEADEGCLTTDPLLGRKLQPSDFDRKVC